MSRPPVSVVVPTHKRPVLLERAVRSILDQGYDGPLEVIVVFDACEVALPTVDLRQGHTLVGFPNERSRGLAGARNTGILRASADFVAFLDDDDFWLPGKLAPQLDAFAREPGAILVGTAMRVTDGVASHTRLLPGERVTYDDLIADRLPALHSSSFVFRREALLGPLGLIDEALPRSYGEDYDILLRTAALRPIVIVNEPLVDVSWSGQSYFFGKWALYAEALQYLLAKHPQFAAVPRATGRIQAQIAFALAASGQAEAARAWAKRSLSNDRRQIKAMLAIAVSRRLLRATTITRVAQRLGRGI